MGAGSTAGVDSTAVDLRRGGNPATPGIILIVEKAQTILQSTRSFYSGLKSAMDLKVNPMDTHSSTDAADLLELSAEVVAAYVSNNSMSASALAGFIGDVHAAFQ